ECQNKAVAGFRLAAGRRGWCNKWCSACFDCSWEGGAMSQGTYLSWEEMQRLALPPDATMLVPPPFQPADVAALAAGPPRTDWLHEGLAPPPAAQPQPGDAGPVDPAPQPAPARAGAE